MKINLIRNLINCGEKVSKAEEKKSYNDDSSYMDSCKHAAIQAYTKMKNHQDGFAVKVCDNRIEFIFPACNWRETASKRAQGVYPLEFCDVNFHKNLDKAIIMCKKYRNHYLEDQKLLQQELDI